MKTHRLLILSVIFFLPLAGVSGAADSERVYSQGNVVAVTHVHVKPGMFDAYISNLNQSWRKYIERMKEDGHVIDYGVYAVPFAREGEPNLVLTVTYKDWATFDLGMEYYDKLAEEIEGGTEASRQAFIKREDLRTMGSAVVLQEVKFKD
ncbi:MAG TPA: hypothetical protein VF254_04645 [Gammaproteobacteria bacterium]